MVVRISQCSDENGGFVLFVVAEMVRDLGVEEI